MIIHKKHTRSFMATTKQMYAILLKRNIALIYVICDHNLGAWLYIPICTMYFLILRAKYQYTIDSYIDYHLGMHFTCVLCKSDFGRDITFFKVPEEVRW